MRVAAGALFVAIFLACLFGQQPVEGALKIRLASRVRSTVATVGRAVAPDADAKKKKAAAAVGSKNPPMSAIPKTQALDLEKIWGMAQAESVHRHHVRLDMDLAVPNPRALKFAAEAKAKKENKGRTKWTTMGMGDADLGKTKAAFVPGCTGYLTKLRDTFRKQAAESGDDEKMLGVSMSAKFTMMCEGHDMVRTRCDEHARELAKLVDLGKPLALATTALGNPRLGTLDKERRELLEKERWDLGHGERERWEEQKAAEGVTTHLLAAPATHEGEEHASSSAPSQEPLVADADLLSAPAAPTSNEEVLVTPEEAAAVVKPPPESAAIHAANERIRLENQRLKERAKVRADIKREKQQNEMLRAENAALKSQEAAEEAEEAGLFSNNNTGPAAAAVPEKQTQVMAAAEAAVAATDQTEKEAAEKQVAASKKAAEEAAAKKAREEEAATAQRKKAEQEALNKMKEAQETIAKLRAEEEEAEKKKKEQEAEDLAAVAAKKKAEDDAALSAAKKTAEEAAVAKKKEAEEEKEAISANIKKTEGELEAATAAKKKAEDDAALSAAKKAAEDSAAKSKSGASVNQTVVVVDQAKDTVDLKAFGKKEAASRELQGFGDKKMNEKEAKKIEEQAAKKAKKVEEKAVKNAKKVEEQAAKKAKKLEEQAAKKAKKLEEQAAKKAKKVDEALRKAKTVEEEAAKKAKKFEEEAAKKAKKVEEEAAKKAKKVEEEAAKKAKKAAEEVTKAGHFDSLGNTQGFGEKVAQKREAANATAIAAKEQKVEKKEAANATVTTAKTKTKLRGAAKNPYGPGLRHPRVETEAVFSKLDKDHDGAISKEEFEHAADDGMLVPSAVAAGPAPLHGTEGAADGNVWCSAFFEDYWTVLRAEDVVLDAVNSFVKSVEGLVLDVERETRENATGVPKCEANHTRADGRGCVDERFLGLAHCNLTNATDGTNATNATNATGDCPPCDCKCDCEKPKCDEEEKKKEEKKKEEDAAADGEKKEDAAAANATNATNATNGTLGPLCHDTSEFFEACFMNGTVDGKFAADSKNGTRVSVPCMLVAEPEVVEKRFTAGCESFVKEIRSGFGNAQVLLNEKGDARLMSGVEKQFGEICESKHRLESWQCEAHAAPLFQKKVSPKDWCTAFWRDYYEVLRTNGTARFEQGPPSHPEGWRIDEPSWGPLPPKNATEEKPCAEAEEKKLLF